MFLKKNQKHILCPGHNICVRSKCCVRGQTGNICVGNNVSARMCPRLLGSYHDLLFLNVYVQLELFLGLSLDIFLSS